MNDNRAGVHGLASQFHTPCGTWGASFMRGPLNA